MAAWVHSQHVLQAIDYRQFDFLSNVLFVGNSKNFGFNLYALCNASLLDGFYSLRWVLSSPF